jgi:soluble lytic murein transglycosylase-like protein
MADDSAIPNSQGPGMGYPSAGVLPPEAPGTPDEVSGRGSYGLPQHTVAAAQAAQPVTQLPEAPQSPAQAPQAPAATDTPQSQPAATPEAPGPMDPSIAAHQAQAIDKALADEPKPDEGEVAPPKPTFTPPNVPWASAVMSSSATAGVDPAVMFKLTESESSGGTNTARTVSGAEGVFQITDGTAEGIRKDFPQQNFGDVQRDPWRPPEPRRS